MNIGALASQSTAALAIGDDKKKEETAAAGNFAALLASLSGTRAGEVGSAEKNALEASKKTSGADEFIAYMQKSPAERMQEAWLKAHGMTKQQFDALPPEKKQALLEQMRAEFEEKIKRETEAKTALVINI